jgi:hypothetical protein
MLDSRRTLAPDHGDDRPGLASALLLGSVQIAGAGVLASGYLWSDDAEAMVCLLLNVSATPVTITAAKIVDVSGTTIATYNGCDQVTLQPGQRCAVRAKTKQAAGIAQLDGPRGRVRANCQLNTVDNGILASTEMR